MVDTLEIMGLGFLKLVGAIILFLPFISGAMMGTDQHDYKKWYLKAYFRYYPIVAICGVALFVIGLGMYVLGK